MAYIKILLGFLIGMEIGFGGMMAHMVKASEIEPTSENISAHIQGAKTVRFVSASTLDLIPVTPIITSTPAVTPSPTLKPTSSPVPTKSFVPNTPTPSLVPTSKIAQISVTLTTVTITPSPTKVPEPIMATTSSGGSVNSNEQATVDIINQRRKDAGLSSLSVNSQLTAAARRESNDNASHSRCEHTGTDGSSPWSRGKDAGFDGQMYGETITCRINTPGEIVEWWWNSPTHKDILTKSDIKQIGLGWSDTTPVYATAVVAF